jgi:hypothetical protein
LTYFVMTLAVDGHRKAQFTALIRFDIFRHDISSKWTQKNAYSNITYVPLLRKYSILPNNRKIQKPTFISQPKREVKTS